MGTQGGDGSEHRSLSTIQTVLVVDDSPTDRSVVAELIKLHGECVVVAVETGAEADHLLENGDIDAVLVDHYLGRERGVTLITRWRERGLDMPMVLMTSAPSNELERLAADAGATAMVAKGDLDTAALLRTLNVMTVV